MPTAPKQTEHQLLQVALQHHQAGRTTQAKEIYLQILQINPGHPDALHLLGTLYYQAGNNELAVESIKHAIRVDPANPFFYDNLGTVYQALGKLEDAAACYQKVISFEPDYAGAHFNLGNVFLRQSLPDQAVTCYRKALALKPDYVNAYVSLGNTLKDLGRVDEAVTCYQKALAFNPNYAEVHFNLGIVLQEQSKLDEAINCYRKTLSLKPDYAEAYGNLGGVLKKLGRLDEALSCYQQQVKLAPENTMARHLIASLTGDNTERAPTQYVEQVFDGYADKFDEHLVQVLKYDAPGKLVAHIAQHSAHLPEKWNILDLGCGTGLVGSAIAPFARQLVGVDLSARMLEKARARNIYQRLEQLDLMTMMRSESTSSYDVIIAADVFVYLGKLDEIISEIKRLLGPNGMFAFSIETLAASSSGAVSQDTQQDYHLENTGRYAHSTDYLARLASVNGFLPQEMEAILLRMDRGNPINGHLVLWKK